MLFSKLYKFMVNKVTFLEFSENNLPKRPSTSTPVFNSFQTTLTPKMKVLHHKVNVLVSTVTVPIDKQK